MCCWFTVMTLSSFFFFFFNDTATTEIYTLSLHDALPICLVEDLAKGGRHLAARALDVRGDGGGRSEEHTSELQSRLHLVCRLLLEKKKQPIKSRSSYSNSCYQTCCYDHATSSSYYTIPHN